MYLPLQLINTDTPPLLLVQIVPNVIPIQQRKLRRVDGVLRHWYHHPILPPNGVNHAAQDEANSGAGTVC